jgi:hypothetical protein
LANQVQRALGLGRVSLQTETWTSGPRKGDECDSFVGVDAAVVYAPSYVWLRELRQPPEELLGVAPVFDEVRNSGSPLYFCDIVVRDDAQIQTSSALEEGSWAYNDVCSLSGYYGLLNKLAESGRDGELLR